MNIKLSFIVPFYNVEKYIAACLDSLYAQDLPLELYEVICIDDCSPDDSKQIVKEYQRRYSNLILIEHERNKALGGARNTGIQAAKGEYIWFIDSDDYIENYQISRLINLCISNKLDVLLFNYQRVDDMRYIIEDGTVFKDEKKLTGNEFVKKTFGSNFIYHLGYVWRCIFKTQYLIDNNLFFPEMEYWEDTEFFPRAILTANRVQSVKDIIYNYRVNSNSISGDYNKFKSDRIFQFSFCAGFNLFHFSQDYKPQDEDIATSLNAKSIWYFNSFSKPLFLCKINEKFKFYQLIKKNKIRIKEIRDYLTFKNRILLVPYLGILISIFLKPIFIYKEKK
jgi:glycosyltransferase involved in cell wall biosynthesis